MTGAGLLSQGLTVFSSGRRQARASHAQQWLNWFWWEPLPGALSARMRSLAFVWECAYVC